MPPEDCEANPESETAALASQKTGKEDIRDLQDWASWSRKEEEKEGEGKGKGNPFQNKCRDLNQEKINMNKSNFSGAKEVQGIQMN